MVNAASVEVVTKLQFQQEAKKKQCFCWAAKSGQQQKNLHGFLLCVSI